MRTLWILTMTLCILLLGCQSQNQKPSNLEPATSDAEDENRQVVSRPETAEGQNNAYPIFIGMVENGAFTILLPENVSPGSVRLTSIGMQVAMPPTERELKLTKYEGTAIAVQGHYGGGWIYSAKVIDTSGPIVTALVRKMLD
jgi:hypothetical protein